MEKADFIYLIVWSRNYLVCTKIPGTDYKKNPQKLIFLFMTRIGKCAGPTVKLI
jgi:hypothetical protein